MKRVLILLLILTPSVAFAKYCPACLRTYQAQTTRGQTTVVYKWMTRVMAGTLPLDPAIVKRLFSQGAVIMLNGKRMATGQKAIYNFFHTELRSQKLLESQMQQVLTDQNDASLKYEFVARKGAEKYRNLAIVLFHFRHHKITTWWELRYTTQINN